MLKINKYQAEVKGSSSVTRSKNQLSVTLDEVSNEYVAVSYMRTLSVETSRNKRNMHPVAEGGEGAKFKARWPKKRAQRLSGVAVGQVPLDQPLYAPKINPLSLMIINHKTAESELKLD